MKDKIEDLWLTFLLVTRLKKLDCKVEVGPISGSECCESGGILLSLSYKWFWQKSSSPDCCS